LVSMLACSSRRLSIARRLAFGQGQSVGTRELAKDRHRAGDLPSSLSVAMQDHDYLGIYLRGITSSKWNDSSDHLSPVKSPFACYYGFFGGASLIHPEGLKESPKVIG